MQSKTAAFLAALAVAAAPAAASDSLFARLVDATSKSDRQKLMRLLSSQKLSTSRITVGADNRLKSGELRHDVPAVELVDKLHGCAVERWRDLGAERGSAFVLWHCPAKRLPGNDCYFYSYRAELLDPRYHPPNLYIGEAPSRDHARCGRLLVPPPQVP